MSQSYIIYARKSTESEDRQVASIGDQVSELRDLAARRGVTVSHVVEESMSAKKPGRPRFGEVLLGVQEDKVAGILCWKLDRLARNPVDGGSILWAMTERKLREIICPGRTYTSSGEDRLMMTIEFGMATKYVDDLSDNVKRGLASRVKRGWTMTMAPAGYLNDRSNPDLLRQTQLHPHALC